MKRLLFILFCASLVNASCVVGKNHDSLQLSLALTPLAWIAAKHMIVDPSILTGNPDASPEISSFIHELLEQHGVNNAHQISVKLGKKYCAGPSTLIIEWLSQDAHVSLLESLIYEYKKIDTGADPEATQDLLNLIFQQIGSIEHEIAHIKNNDLKKRAVFLTAVSACSYALLKLLEKAYTHYLLPEHHNQSESWQTHALYSLASGTFLATCNMFALFKLDRAQERAADANISNNAAILLAKANQHAEIHESLKSYVQNKWYGERFFWLFERFPSLYIMFDWQHPASLERAQTFANRLAELLNKQDDTHPYHADIL